MLRSAPYNCDLIIALTHMRVPKDRHLAAEVPEIDFILGGHDHLYVNEVDSTTGAVLIKSGTDFEEFSNFDVFFNTSLEDYELAKQEDTELTKHLYSP